VPTLNRKQVWQLEQFALDEACCEAMVDGDGVPTLIRLLGESGIPTLQVTRRGRPTNRLRVNRIH
jgi:hypothetical protein